MDNNVKNVEPVVKPMRVYTFKGPVELEEALFEVVKRLNKPKSRVTKSSLICDAITGHQDVARELQRIMAKKKKKT